MAREAAVARCIPEFGDAARRHGTGRPAEDRRRQGFRRPVRPVLRPGVPGDGRCDARPGPASGAAQVSLEAGHGGIPMSRIATLLAALLIAGCAPIDAPPPDIVKELAPTGPLRAALQTDDGVAREVATDLARRLRVPLQTTTFDAPFDIAFVLPDAARAAQLDFTAPYMILD